MLGKLALALVTALVFAAPAVAGDIGVTLGFQAGTLGVKTQSAAIGVTTSRVAVTVVDARGSGKGWVLRLEGAGRPTVTRISMRCAAGSTCTLPTGTALLPSIVGTTPTTVFAAAPTSGMGAIEIVLTLSGGNGRLGVTVAPR
jgi:hypothetical protein